MYNLSQRKGKTCVTTTEVSESSSEKTIFDKSWDYSKGHLEICKALTDE